MKTNTKLELVFILGVCSLITLAIGVPPQRSSKASPKASQKIKAVDILREIHLYRRTFDRNYKPPYNNPLRLAQTPTNYPEWEDIYFSREKYRKRLEDLIRRDWSVGPWWWQASVRVYPKDPLVRGGPIYFVIRYPRIDDRDSLVIAVTKLADGRTFIHVKSGAYYTPRHSYLSATFIMLGLFVLLAAALLGASFVLYRFAIWAIAAFAEKVAPGHGRDQWVWRFSACVLGAAAWVIITFVWALIH